jgi:hypothetical protein
MRGNIEKIVVRLRYTFDVATQEKVLQQLVRTKTYYLGQDQDSRNPFRDHWTIDEQWESVDFEYE